MSKRLIESYNETLAAYGDNPQAVQWGTEETQYFRFKILLEMERTYGEDCVVFDYGCGKGDLFFYMLFNGFKGTYIGVDINEKMIAFARKKYKGHARVRFHSITSEADIRNFKYDYAFVSGTFNDKGNKDLLKRSVPLLYKNARSGVAFNALSTYARSRAKGVPYHDPVATTAYCLKTITPFTTLRHDYRGGNFTIYVYKNRGVDF